jgi:hypothetical protein
MKQTFTFLFAFISLGLYAQTCSGRYQTEIYNQVDVSTVDYGSAVNRLGQTVTLQMDIYQAVGDTATDRPVVIFCFGGSFTAGSRTSGELVDFATDLAKRGYVCASIDYRLAGSPLELVIEENIVKVVFSAVQDGKAAIRYFRKDFEEGNSLGIDPNNIFIGGTSAGGILAANLAYVDEVTKLPAEWQVWADENGGLEGSSGNPGYCSAPNGVFGFAGAVGDTAYIDANDPPFYGCHSTGDQTVQYGYGAPLQGFAPVSLYGSGDIATRMDNLGIYNELDTYNDGAHPPFFIQDPALSAQRTADTRDNLVNFLYNILDCNPNNLKKEDQQGCDTGNPTSIAELNARKEWNLFPNPTDKFINVISENEIQRLIIVDAMGREMISFNDMHSKELAIEVQDLSAGVYFVYVQSGGVWTSEKLMVK